MQFGDFLTLMPKVTNMQLPGQHAHHKMAPLSRITELKELDISSRNPKRAAVLSLFYPDVQNATKLLLIHRKDYKGVHGNQVGFPGGKMEVGDESLLHTALRETEEEVGVPAESIEVLKELTELYIPPSNFLVKPYLGITKRQPAFLKQESEVEAIIEVTLTEYLNDAAIFSQKLTTSYAIAIDVPAFRLNGFTVWGATAMILSELKEMLTLALKP